MRAATASTSSLSAAWAVLLRELRTKVGFAAPGLPYAAFADRLETHREALWPTFVELHTGCTSDVSLAYEFEHAPMHVDVLPFEKPFDQWTERERRLGNIEVFRVLRRVQSGLDALSDGDRKLLTAWSGWGGIKIEDVPLDPEVFTDDYLEALAEWRALRRKGNVDLPVGYVPKSKLLLGAVNQFFTPNAVCEFMWRVAERAARASGLPSEQFKTCLEPSAGSGRFLATAPKMGAVANLTWTTVELDDIGSGVIRGAYPDHQHYHTTFERVAAAAMRAPKLFDMIIGNPPYPERMASDRLDDPDLSHYDQAHTYFVRRCADLLKPGGIMVMLTPLGQIHAEGTARPELVFFRRDMLTLCDFLGAAAIPADVFPGATLNLAVHVWRRKLPRDIGVPAQIAGVPLKSFLNGKYFETAGAPNVLGEWKESKRYRSSYYLSGPFSASMGDTVVLDETPCSPDKLRDILVLRAAYKEPPELEIQASSESLADKLRRQTREVGEVSIDALVAARARSLSSRVERYLSTLSSDPSLARVGRGELLLDVQAFIDVIGNPRKHRLTEEDAGCFWLREIVSDAGTIAPHLLEGDDGQERPRTGSTFASADEAIRWYSSRTGRCTPRDMHRHGFSEEDAMTAVQTAPDLAVVPSTSSSGDLDFQRKSEFLAAVGFGSAWDLLDTVGALRSQEGLDQDLKFCYDRQFVWLTDYLRPVSLAEINPEPRAPYVTEDILSAFATWWVRDATPGGTTQEHQSDKVYPYCPGVRMVKTNEVWQAYPARLMPRSRRVLEDIIAPVNLEDPNTPPEQETFPRSAFRYIYSNDAKVTEEGKKLYAVRWEPLPDVQDLGSVTWANYWNILGPSKEQAETLIKNSAIERLHGYDWFKEWRGTEAKPGSAEDRYYVLMAHLNQTNAVMRLGGSQDRMVSRITLIEGVSNDGALTDAFSYWLSKNQWAVEKIVTAYNRTFRGQTTRDYPGEELTIYRRVSAGSGINLLPYQWSTCRRMADTLACVAALDVGFGKTFTGIAGIALARQQGAIRRPVVKVPPSVTTNWFYEAQRLLPDYLVIVVGYTYRGDADGKPVWSEDSAAERAAKWRAYAQGLGDLLIVPETKWADDVAMTADSIIQIFQTAYVSRRALAAKSVEIETLKQKIENAKRQVREAMSSGAAGKAEAAEKRLTSLVEKLATLEQAASNEDKKSTGKSIYTLARKLDLIRTTQPFRPVRSYSPWSEKWSVDKLLDTMEKAGITPPEVPEGATTADYHRILVDFMRETVTSDRGTIVVPHLITWEELDCDCLLIDEAHRDKNIMGPETKQQIEFLGAPPGDTRSALDTWLRCQWLLQRYGRGVMLLTATPLKNSPLELYNLLSLVSQTVWTSRGVGDPDGFIARYIRIEEDITITAKGVPEPRQVVAGFKKLAELREVVRALMERKTTEDLIAYYQSIGQLDAYRRNFPESEHHILSADLDDIQLRIFEPIRQYLLMGTGIAGVDADGNCKVLSGAQREAERKKVLKTRAEEGNLSRLEEVFNEIEEEDPGRFALMLKDLLEKAALDPRLLEQSRIANLAALPAAATGVYAALDAFTKEGRKPPSKKELDDLLGGGAWQERMSSAGYKLDEDTGEVVGSSTDSAAGVGAGGVVAKRALDKLTQRLLTAVRAQRACLNNIAILDLILINAAGLDVPGTRDSDASNALTSRDFQYGKDPEADVVSTISDDQETPEGFHITRLFTELYELTQTHPPKMTEVARTIVRGGERAKGGKVKLPCASIIFAEYTSVHGWLIDALVAAGIPRDRIAVMDGSVKVHRRQALANEFTGTAKTPRIYDVLIANSVAYEGMNLQRETCAVYHLDLPWEPASMHQREGRAVRQGNLWGRVDIYTVLSPGTLDPFKYSIVEGKRAWQSEFYNGADDEMDNPEKDAAKVSREELVANLVFYKSDADSLAARKCLLDHVRRIREQKRKVRLITRLLPAISALQAAAHALAGAKKTGDATLISLAQDALHRPAQGLRTLIDAVYEAEDRPVWHEELIDAAYAGPVGFAWIPAVPDPRKIEDFLPVIYRVGDVVIRGIEVRGYGATGEAPPFVRVACSLYEVSATARGATFAAALDAIRAELSRNVQNPWTRATQFATYRLTAVFPEMRGEKYGSLSANDVLFASSATVKSAYQTDEGSSDDDNIDRHRRASLPLHVSTLRLPFVWNEEEHAQRAVQSLRGLSLLTEYPTPNRRPLVPSSVLARRRPEVIRNLVGYETDRAAFLPFKVTTGLSEELVNTVTDRPSRVLVLRQGDTFFLGHSERLVHAIRYIRGANTYERRSNPSDLRGVLPSWVDHIYLGAPEPAADDEHLVYALLSDGTLRSMDSGIPGYELVMREDKLGSAFAAAFATGNVRMLRSTWSVSAAARAEVPAAAVGEQRVKIVVVPDITDDPMTATDLDNFRVGGDQSPLATFRNVIGSQIGSAPTSVEIARFMRRVTSEKKGGTE